MDETAVEQVGVNLFRASIGEHWSSLQGAHGGIVAALSVRATEETLKALEVSPTLTMRAATFGYASGNVIGDVHISVDVIRRGRNMVTAHATVTQSEKVTTVARFHFSEPWPGRAFSDVAAPQLLPSEMTVGFNGANRVTHLNNADVLLDTSRPPFGNSDTGEWRAWGRPKGFNTFDAAWLTMYGDFFPPAVFARNSQPSRAVTIEYSIQIHEKSSSWTLESDEYLPTHMHVFHSHDGLAVEDGRIWLPDGRLLATSRQTRLAGE
jgi:acyl-CoA thioesterase